MREVVALVESLAPAIDYAAERGVHHGLLHVRDIVLSADRARITGFGISAVLSNIGVKLPMRPQYSSSDAASDVYSLGAIAFEAATGKRVSADNLKELEAEHGTNLRRAFELPLAANPAMRPKLAGDFAAALAGAKGAMGAKVRRVRWVQKVRRVRVSRRLHPPHPLHPSHPLHPPHLLHPLPPIPTPTSFCASTSPSISWGSPTSQSTASSIRQYGRCFQHPGRPAVAGVSDRDQEEPDPASRRWPIVAMSLGFAVLAALSVGFFLSSPRPAPATEQEPAVDETIIDLPASAPSSPNATAGKPAPVAPNAPVAPIAPNTRVARNAPSTARAVSARVGSCSRTQTGSVLVRSTPANADVLLNGTLRGKTPLALRDLALGIVYH